MGDQGQQRYRVIERLASGGMAEVFLAESAGVEGFKKQVAIKRVLPHLSEKKRFMSMFLDEARLSAHLNHSNVAQVFDIGVGDNTYFIVMEYVKGADLKQLVKHLRDHQRHFPMAAAVYISSKICEGLSYAHELTNTEGERLNAVHRDVSPPNVLISEHGEIKIVDFGLAKASTQLEKSEAGIIKGKFSYLSPEAAHGQDVDARADIFAVGIILWEMLAGRRLFQGNSDYETVKLVQEARVPPVAGLNPEAADPELDRILRRALARERDQRYPTARELGRDLTRLLFRLGEPVDAFDIAQLVRGPMGKREHRPEDGASIIDKLISETLLQFTSLRDKSQPAAGPASSKPQPFSLGNFEEFSKWTEDSQSDQQAARLVANTLPAQVFEDGNLAALEGDDPLAPRGSFGGSSLPGDWGRDSQSALPGVPPSDPASRRPGPATPSFAPPDKGSAVLKGLLLVLIAAGTAAAVWFSGLL